MAEMTRIKTTPRKPAVTPRRRARAVGSALDISCRFCGNVLHANSYSRHVRLKHGVDLRRRTVMQQCGEFGGEEIKRLEDERKKRKKAGSGDMSVKTVKVAGAVVLGEKGVAVGELRAPTKSSIQSVERAELGSNRSLVDLTVDEGAAAVANLERLLGEGGGAPRAQSTDVEPSDTELAPAQRAPLAGGRTKTSATPVAKKEIRKPPEWKLEMDQLEDPLLVPGTQQLWVILRKYPGVPVEELVEELAEKCDWDTSTRRSARARMTALEFAREETVREFGASLLPAADQTPAAALRSLRDLRKKVEAEPDRPLHPFDF